MPHSDKQQPRDERRKAENDQHATGAGAVAGGTAGGVAGGVLAGATTGGITGPVGAAIGAAIGAVAGALSGKAINWAAEEPRWKDDFSSRPYVGPSALYIDYEPAYRLGYERSFKYRGAKFDDIEPELRRDWESERGESRLSWDDARHAARDAFERKRDSN
jgi:hypothetical protein